MACPSGKGRLTQGNWLCLLGLRQKFLQIVFPTTTGRFDLNEHGIWEQMWEKCEIGIAKQLLLVSEKTRHIHQYYVTLFDKRLDEVRVNKLREFHINQTTKFVKRKRDILTQFLLGKCRNHEAHLRDKNYLIILHSVLTINLKHSSLLLTEKLKWWSRTFLKHFATPPSPLSFSKMSRLLGEHWSCFAAMVRTWRSRVFPFENHVLPQSSRLKLSVWTFFRSNLLPFRTLGPVRKQPISTIVLDQF